MLALIATVLVFAGGFIVMVLEIIGARYLAKDFGGSFYVWISQIGVILSSIALGYAVGGMLADRFRRASVLAVPLLVTGAMVFFIPEYAQPLVDAIVLRHADGEPIPAVWQKLDPAMGSAVVFFLPCAMLAVLPPYIIRLVTRELSRVGTTSGLVYAASTVGGIAGVFISGYVLIDQFGVPDIFRLSGLVTALLAGLAWRLDRHLSRGSGVEPGSEPTE